MRMTILMITNFNAACCIAQISSAVSLALGG